MRCAVRVLFCAAIAFLIAKPASAQDAGRNIDTAGSEFRPDAVDSKLFFGPTARSLRRGEGYFAIESLFLPAFQVGVTDRFSIGVGAPFYGFVRTAWVTPKLQLYNDEKVAVAAGALHLLSPDAGLGGFGYVVTTIGTRHGAVTVGGGVLYGRGDAAGETAPMIMIGGDRRLTRRIKLVVESYVFDGGLLAMVGTRVVGRRVSAEFGAIVPFVGGAPVPGIVVNFVVHPRRQHQAQ